MLGWLKRIPLLNRLPVPKGVGSSEPYTRFDGLADFIANRARRIVIFGAVFFVVGGAVGGSVFNVLQPFGFDDPDTESIIARDRLASAGGVESEPGVVALVRSEGGVFSAEGTELVASTQEAVALSREIASTASIAAGGLAVAQEKDAGELPAMVSEDGQSTYVLGYFRATTDDKVKQEVATEIEERLDKLGPGVTLGGIATAYGQINKQVEHDLQMAELIVFPLLFLLSLWVFRGLIAAALPPLIAALSVVGSLVGLRLIAEMTDLSIFAVNLVTAVGLGLSIDYSLFVVSRYREELAKDSRSPKRVLRRTMRTAGRTVMFSGLTVAAAMASLLIFPQRFLYSMGVGGTLVAIFAALVSLTILPAILYLLGKRVNSLSPSWLERRAEQTARPATEGFWYRLSQFVMRRPVTIAVVTSALMIVIALPFLNVKWTFADASVLPKSASAREVDRIVNSEFPPNRTDPIQIQIGRNAEVDELTAYIAELDALEGVEESTPPREVGRGVQEIDVFYAEDHFSEPTKALVRDIRGLDPPFTARVGGSTARFIDQDSSLKHHLPWMLAIVAVTTILVLFMMTGSVILPVKALIMNILTVSAAFGILVLVFQDGRFEGLLAYEGNGGVDNSNALLMFAVAFGLSTDYGVFLLTRIKEAWDSGKSNNESVAIGMERTGRLITAAALLLCVAVLGFSTSKIIFIKEFSIGVAAAVALDATIVRALLVPSLMVLLGKWNWWAPGPLRRFYERYGVAET